jgi:hypothetical protein
MSHGPNFIDEPKPLRSIQATLAAILAAALDGLVRTAPPVRVRLAPPLRQRARRYRYKPVMWLAAHFHREYGSADPATLPRRVRRMRLAKPYEVHTARRLARPALRAA